MASSNSLFLRPIELTSSNDSYNFNSGGSTNLNNGVYNCVYTIAKALADACSISVALSKQGVGDIRLYLYSGSNFTLSWVDTNLRNLLGFTQGDLSGDKVYLAESSPENVFFPSYTKSNRDYFFDNVNNTVNGVNAANGRFYGLQASNVHKHIELEFPHEQAINVASEFATSSYHLVRNFEYFFKQSLISKPSSTTGCETTGFWYMPDYTTSDSILTLTTSGGTNFNLNADPDFVAYCSLNKAEISKPSVSLPKGQTHFNLNVAFSTATAPDFNYPA